MHELASEIRRQLDTLAQSFERRIRGLDGYAELSDRARLDNARQDLALVLSCLEDEDHSGFRESIEGRVSGWLEQGRAVTSLMQGLAALEETLLPLIIDVRAAKFVWRMLSDARAAVLGADTASYSQVDERTAQSQEALQTILDSMPFGVTVITKDKTIRHANRAALTLMGYESEEQIIGRLCHDTLCPADRDRCPILDLGQEVDRSERVLVTKDGKHVPVLKSVVPMSLAGQEVLLEAFVDVSERRRAEEELRESQQMLRSVLDSMPFGVVVIAKDKTVIQANRAALTLMGYESEEQIIGRLCHDTLCPADRDRCPILDLGQEVDRSERVLVTKDGKHVPVLKSVVPISLAGQEVLLEAFVDVSERRAAEGELRESQQMLQLIMDNVPQRVFWKSRELVYLGCNRAFAEQRGLGSPDEVVGKTDFDLSQKEQAERFRADDLQVMETGEAKLNYEEPQITADGQRRWLRTSKVPLRDTEGNVWAVLGMYEDITEHKQTEVDLQRLARAVEATHDAVVITDLEGDIRFVNSAFEELTGYSRQEALEQNPRILKSGQQSDEVYTAMWQTITSGDAWQGEVTNRRKDGSFYEAQLTISPVRGADGEVEEFVAIQRDISERAAVEREREQVYARRAEQVRASVEVSQELAAVPELGELFRRVVTVIKGRFGYYHVQIFRYEPTLDAVVLVAGYGEPGERMLAEGHSLPMRRGVVGTAAATGESVLIPDTSEEPDWVPNPHLPDTKGELAVPIKIRDRVLGIVDVQADVRGALDEDDLLLLESISGPIALAIESTMLRQEMEDNLRELAAMQRTVSQDGWAAFRQTSDLPDGYLFDRVAVRPAGDLWEPEIRRAMQRRSLVAPDRLSTERQVGVGVHPIMVQNEPVGVLGVYQDPDHPLSPEDLDLVRQVSEQVAVALENARLAEMTQDALAEARTLYRFGELVSSETDVEAVYESVAQSLVMELGYDSAFIGVLDEDAESLQEVARVTSESNGTPHLASGGQDIASIAVRQREPVVINDPLHDDRVASTTSDDQLWRLAAVPVFTEEEVLGVIGVSRSFSEAEISERDVRIIEAVAIQMANAIQRAQLFEQTQQALAAADAATQRYLRDTWDAFLSGSTMESEGYLATLEGVVPARDLWLPEMERALERGEAISVVVEPGAGSDQPRAALAVPLKTRGQVIGIVDFYREGTAEGWTEREQELIQALVDQIGDSVESERQFAQTQATLAETERMYQASRRISSAQDADEILQVLLDVASSTVVDQAVVLLFGQPVTEGWPAAQSLAAYWDRTGEEPPEALGTESKVDGYPLVRLMSRDESLVVPDILADGRLDDAMLGPFAGRGCRALAAVPLVVGNEWLGYSVLMVRAPHAFTTSEMRIHESVHDQAATALRSARLYAEAQSRARREQLIREITSKMRGTPDLDTILNTAVQELGRALGVSRAFVRLSTKASVADEPAEGEA